MVKDDGAFLTIGELAQELGVAQHILRYWETRFTQLRPLQRSGNRRYYRPADVEIARRINNLLNEEGFTMRGAQRVLADRRAEPPAMEGMGETVAAQQAPSTLQGGSTPQGELPIGDERAVKAPPRPRQSEPVEGAELSLLITRLSIIRKDLEEALAVR